MTKADKIVAAILVGFITLSWILLLLKYRFAFF